MIFSLFGGDGGFEPSAFTLFLILILLLLSEDALLELKKLFNPGKKEA